MWWLACFLDTIFQCTPVQAQWDSSIRNAKCQNLKTAALATAFSNMILDVVFLLLPLPMIWGLHLDRKFKLSITGIFLLGGFVCATSIVRIYAIFTSNYSKADVTWDGYAVNLWSTVESCCSVIAACLPTMRPLITRVKKLRSHGSEGSRRHRSADLGLPSSSQSAKAPLRNIPRSSRSFLKAPYQSIDDKGVELESRLGVFPMKIFAEPVRPVPIHPSGRTFLGPHDPSEHHKAISARSKPLPRK